MKIRRILLGLILILLASGLLLEGCRKNTKNVKIKLVSTTVAQGSTTTSAGGTSTIGIGPTTTRRWDTTTTGAITSTSYTTTTTLESGFDLPGDLLGMVDYIPQKTYFIAANEHGASNSNDGISPTYQGGNKGPWLSMEALRSHSISPGDGIAIREGTYFLDKSSMTIKLYGTSTKPIKIFAYQGEKPVIKGGFTADQIEEYAKDPKKYNTMVYFGGVYTVIDGLTFTGCYRVCMTIWDAVAADHLVLINNKFDGSLEDQIKTTTSSSNLLIWKNEFTRFSNEALDAFGVQTAHVVENHFHDRESAYRDPSAIMWTKGGANDVHVLGNMFENADVQAHALMAGGCCWNSWDSRYSDGRLKPVATNIELRQNTIRNINILSSFNYAGAVGVEGCDNCQIEDNLIMDSQKGIGVHPTQSGDEMLHAKDITITGNTIVRAPRIISIRDGSHTGLALKNNVYYVDDPKFNFGTKTYDFNGFRNLGYESGSSLHPESDYR